MDSFKELFPYFPLINDYKGLLRNALLSCYFASVIHIVDNNFEF